VLSRLPGARVRFLADAPGPVRTDNGMLQVVAEAALDDAPAPDVLVVPGGISSDRYADDARHVEWIRRAHETSTWTTSVCTGAILLAAKAIQLLIEYDPQPPFDSGSLEKAAPETAVLARALVAARGPAAGV
jgi:putative intracellular protease/amidase